MRVGVIGLGQMGANMRKLSPHAPMVTVRVEPEADQLCFVDCKFSREE